jgi:hypothetical protein
MRLSRVRFTLRAMMVWVAILAALFGTARFVFEYQLPRDGFHSGTLRYLGRDWKWHEVSGAVIFVKNGKGAFVD